MTERAGDVGECEAGRAVASDGETEREVERPGDQALGQDDRLGGDVVDAGGDAVVEAPAHAGCGDEQGADAQLCTGLPDEQRPADGDERGAEEQAASEVLAEHGGGECDGGDELEVQQDRRRRRVDPGQAGDEQQRSQCAAGHDRDRQGLPRRSHRSRSGRWRTTAGATAMPAPR